MAAGMPMGMGGAMGGGQPPTPPPMGAGPSPALQTLAKKPSTPDSGAPLLQMIMTLLAGAGMKDFTSSLTSLLKAGQGGSKATGMQHAKQPGQPPGMQPSKPGQPPAPPPGAPPAGGPAMGGKPGGAGIPPQLLQQLLAMLMGGGQQPPQQ